MKTLFSKTGLLACAALLFSAGVLFAGIEGGQPRMEAAIKFLQEAKKADNPLPLLEKARNELAHASHNKAGWRPKAIHMVDEAIAKANEGDKQGVEDKCGHAIAEIHTGMSKAP
jgi:hypothetical protein